MRIAAELRFARNLSILFCVLVAWGSWCGRVSAANDVNIQASMNAVGEITAVDQTTGRVLISPNTLPVWTPAYLPVFESLPPTRSIVPHPDGFDIVFDFHNTGSVHRSLGTIQMPGIRMPNVIQSRDFYVEGKVTTLDNRGQNFFDGGLVYPGSMYSPVAILDDSQYTMGVSLNFPLTQYKHNTFVRIESPGGNALQNGRSWMVRYDLNPTYNVDPDQVLYSGPGEFAPNARRVYTMSVRFLRNASDPRPQAWLQTLKPYRDFFRCLFGAVKYNRDARPVLGVPLAHPELAVPGNPRGFADPYFRPDVFGWGPRIAQLGWFNSLGWDRFTLWCPTGVYMNNRGNNFPYQFTSEWATMPQCVASQGVLAGFASPSRELGLWWGRAAQVMTTWDTPTSVRFDPANPSHIATANAELAGAVAVNATVIGLDTFSLLAGWKQHAWITSKRQSNPNIKFIVEPMPCDVVHNVAGAYIQATRLPSSSWFRVENPHFLADFLNPGHETWGQISDIDVPREFGVPEGTPLTAEQIRSLMARTAGWGYVPQIFGAVELPGPVSQWAASESWLNSVPAELQIAPVPQITNHPQDQRARVGGESTFEVQTTGLPGETFAWELDGVSLSDNGRIQGSTTPALLIASVVASDFGHYRARVVNTCGQVISDPAVLTPGCNGDFNFDLQLNPDDLADYIGSYFSGVFDSRADMNGDGEINPDDLADFIGAYFAGC